MKRVLIVQNHYLNFGGDDSVVANESAMLRSRGHEVSLWTLRNDDLNRWGPRLETALHLAYNPAVRDRLAQHIAEFQPDVMHCHNLFPRITWSAYDAAAQAGVPVIQTLHDFRSVCCANGFQFRDGKDCDLCVKGSTYWAAWHRCYRDSWLGSLLVARALDVHRRAGTLQRRVHRFIALSESARRQYVEAGVPADRTVVKPNFIMDPGSPPAGAREGALFVGRLTAEKGVRVLARAWEEVDAPLQVLGTGPLEADLRAASNPRITLRGHQPWPEVAAAMRRASLLVMPSIALEGFPMVIAEAFACGLPVIAGRFGTMAETIEDGVTGLLCTPGDAADLAAKVAWALAHPQRLAEMGAEARRVYEARYSDAANHRQLIEIYEQAAASRGAEVAA
ncbi:glycosyltransferase family 4 protein [Caldimonas brevitalea]|uniref:Glycosyltransferase n=1 Tax=Caldimonas brevitalea TaxID=413882 RepID=A0A0G3BR21_9BURK|nr:glycosyltransferase family 4 protein [Caldimonas brevitalea]AKJ31872.1 glycosyltransferase [Caldimonas brevitalea]